MSNVFDTKAKERFWSKVNIQDPNACWVWKRKTVARYPTVLHKGFWYKAHRVAWMIHNGKTVIPENKVIRHKCDNTQCVNPTHLIIGTMKDNCADRELRGRGGQMKRVGVGNGRAKISTEDAKLIKCAPETHTRAELAKKFGIKPEMVSLIRRGLNWKHI